MKKVLAVAAIATTMLAVGTGAYAATYVNGEDVTNEVFTTISNDYTLFPVRYLGEKLGCDVSWNPNDKCISVSKGDIHRDFYNGSTAVYDWNGNSYNLVTAPKLVDGNTMVPAEFYRDNFGISVIWDDVTSSLFINSEDTYNWLVNTNEYQQTKNKPKVNQIGADEARQLVIDYYGCATGIFKDEDDNFYYLVPYARYNQIMDTYEIPMGYCKVNKKTGEIIELARER